MSMENSHIRTPEQVAEQIADAQDGRFMGLRDARYDAALAAVEADRAQRPEGRVLTVPSADWRVRVESPRETFEALADLLTDYTFDEIEWEAN